MTRSRSYYYAMVVRNDRGALLSVTCLLWSHEKVNFWSLVHFCTIEQRTEDKN